MDRRTELVHLARLAAVAYGQQHSYTQTRAPFDPHEWVIKAMEQAWESGHSVGYNDAFADQEGK
ncbi:hypothetical protein [Xanthomonas phage DMF5-T1]|nr:hypothetical protein [Xanthomonas phage DMF5-T1]